MRDTEIIGRFAPSPTGRMHAGNIYAALIAWLEAKSQGGKILLRIEDLDQARSHKEYADQMMRDFETLGLVWDMGPIYQSKNSDLYNEAYAALSKTNHIYPCFCTRAEINAASAASAPNGPQRVYAGTCRNLSKDEQMTKFESLKENLRACSYRIEVPNETIEFRDGFQGDQLFSLAHDCGDFVLKRSDGQFAYQLAVVVDDATSGVVSVVRGCDLLPSAAMQIFLAQELGYTVPEYAHIPLFCDESGRRLAKRNKDAELGALIQSHGSVEAVLGHIAYIGKLQDSDEPIHADELLKTYDHDTFAAKIKDISHIEFT